MNNNQEDETIDIIVPPADPLIKWIPRIGRETADLLGHLNIPDAGKATLRDEAQRILGKCIPPTEIAGGETGLVVGYVQSGKTMSFTAVTALARDNAYHMVIVIAGTSVNLLAQSTTRLKDDLRLNTRQHRKWLLLTNPSQPEFRIIRDTLAEWKDATVSDNVKQTVLITVMKHHRYLYELAEILRGLDLRATPTLIIDDEGDQASLNTLVNLSEESTTYRRILELRRSIPHRSYLQYTATPQAPLLINIIDFLSPSFAEVITPGEAYVGGRDFFMDVPGLIDIIPNSEVLTQRNILTQPPDSLLRALSIFFVGVAAGSIVDDERGNRTMIVHPSQRKDSHSIYKQWVDQIKDTWQQILELADTEPDRIELLEDFEDAYRALARTVNDIPTFDEISHALLRAVRRTQTVELNTRIGRTPEVNWRDTYSHILVGGQAMDRGFTVEGLTVTYMPRSLGVGNADTLQQRARFFGYKRRYLGYCRVFVTEVARRVYQSYIRHEEDIRQQLIECRDQGTTLYDWRRAFLMPNALRPTRRNVIDISYVQGGFNDDWFTPHSPHIDETAVIHNRALVSHWLDSMELSPDQGHEKRTADQRHLVNEQVNLGDLYDEFLTHFKVSTLEDTRYLTGLLLQVRNYIERFPDETCTVFQIHVVNGVWEDRERLVRDNDQIGNLFQGAYPVEKAVRGTIYPGDQNIGDHNRLIIQVHKLTLTQDRRAIMTEVPTIAVWVPSKMGHEWLIQDENVAD